MLKIKPSQKLWNVVKYTNGERKLNIRVAGEIFKTIDLTDKDWNELKEMGVI